MTQDQILERINRLREEKNVCILAHYYQAPEIQDLADFIGDSLELARQASRIEADVILFCGVTFMAETAKILAPDKRVLVPDMDAGCSLQDSCPADAFAEFRAAHPDHISLTYINCSAEVKALSDIIVTSSSAEHIINQIPKDQPILFAPDKNLGAWLSRRTGRKMTIWDGICIVHESFSEKELLKLMTRHPDAAVIAHPECSSSILDYADMVGSTSKLLEFAQTTRAGTIIVATEPHILHQMRKAAPTRRFIGAPGADGNCNCNICPYMALNTTEKILDALETMTPEIEVPESIRIQALRSLQKMLDMAPKRQTVAAGQASAR